MKKREKKIYLLFLICIKSNLFFSKVSAGNNMKKPTNKNIEVKCEKEFACSSLYLTVFKYYNIKFGTSKFFSEDEFAHIRYWFALHRGVIEKQLLYFLISYIFIFVRDLQESNSRNMNLTVVEKENMKKEKEQLKDLMTNVNYEGMENLNSELNEINSDENKILQYEIIPLRIKTKKEKEEAENYLLLNKKNMEGFFIRYGLLPNLNIDKNTKQLFTKCAHCNKSEIREILKSMKVTSFQIIYLKSRERYVYIKLLKITDFSKISLNILNYIYIKNGISFLKNNRKKQKLYFYEILHDFFCT
jgi:hypothetical protein